MDIPSANGGILVFHKDIQHGRIGKELVRIIPVVVAALGAKLGGRLAVAGKTVEEFRIPGGAVIGVGLEIGSITALEIGG
jgi:hypothetical protein